MMKIASLLPILIFILLMTPNSAPAQGIQAAIGDGDPRALLEKDWGPLPVPAGATYDARCSEERRVAIFFLGMKHDSVAFSRAKADFRADMSMEKLARKAGRPPTAKDVQRSLDLLDKVQGGGTTESMQLVQRTETFLNQRGMVDVSHLGAPLLQMPANTPKVARIGYTLAATIDGMGGGTWDVPSCSGGPTVEFGRR